MDDFFKSISKNEPVLKNYEVEVKATSAAPAPSSTPDIKDPTEKFPVTEQAQIVKDDTANTPVLNVAAAARETDEYGFGFYTVKPEEPVVEKESSSNELLKMLEQAGETTDFLS